MNLVKIITYIFLLISCCIAPIYGAGANCDYVEGASITGALDGCLSDSQLVNPGDGLVTGSVKVTIIEWTTRLASFFGLLAVGAIVYGGLLMTLSIGDDEKIKKGKDVVKWALLGFLALICAGALVRLVVELMFSFTA